MTITDQKQLESLLNAGIFDRPMLTVDVQLPGRNEIENQLLASKLNRYYNACGCGDGKFFIVLALIVFFAQGLGRGDLTWSWYYAGVAFLYCLAGAFIGKTWGQLRAYHKLRKTIREELAKTPSDEVVGSLSPDPSG